MNNDVNINGVWLHVSECITCGVRYTVPTNMWREQKTTGGYHYCSNGHSQGWDKDGCENARLRRERDRLKQRLAQKDDRIQEEKHRAAAFQGQITKMKKRASAGVCPCCNRSFQNLKRHMSNKHPDYADNVVSIDKATA